ncbi:PAAR domain-containing protein, partial [Vibrio anguillarum]
MSAQAEGRGLIHKGDKTTTGGVVTSGVGNVMFLGEGVTQIKMIATCPACKKGQGEIIPLEAIAVIVENMQVALHGDIVACDCPFGSNTLIASAGAMKFSQSNGQVHGFKPHASPQDMDATYQSVANSMGGHYSSA